MKKITIIGIVAGIALSTISVYADNRDDVKIPEGPSFSSVSPVEEKVDSSIERSFKNNATSTALLRLQAQGDRLIKERINSLESNKTVILANKSLTDIQKSTITNLISKNTSELNTLRTSISSSVDASSTKMLVKNVYTQFRIYGIVIPQIRLEKRIYDLQNHSSKLSDTFLKVQVKIDEAKAKGTDVTIWQKSLDDAKVLVAGDMFALNGLLTKVTALTPLDYGTTSKAVITSVNSGMKVIAQDFNSIKKNLHRPTTMKTSSRKIVGGGSTVVSPLFGTSWTWVSGTDNGVSITPKNTMFVISFGEDNHVSSKTDCNTLTGSYTIDALKLTFSPLAMTMMFCDAAQLQEGQYAQLLGKVTSYKVEGQQLTLSFDNGSLVYQKK